jgi:hypothetical protein
VALNTNKPYPLKQGYPVIGLHLSVIVLYLIIRSEKNKSRMYIFHLKIKIS